MKDLSTKCVARFKRFCEFVALTKSLKNTAVNKKNLN